MKPLNRLTGFLACALVAMTTGCSETKPTPSPAPKATTTGHEGHSHETHAHADHGPHGGDLVELGKEEYHAEVVHDDATGKVTVYVLGSDAKKAEPIEATTVTINVKHDGKGEQFQLAAAPQEGDGEGKSSRFVSEDKELAADLEHDARLVLEINGKSYSGAIKHDHGHDHGHSHDKK